MIYNISSNGNMICSTDGSIKNMVKPFNKWDIVDNTLILTEPGELYYKDKTYKITEPCIVFITYEFNDNKDTEIIIIPCKDAINKLVELLNQRNKFEEERKQVKPCCDCDCEA